MQFKNTPKPAQEAVMREEKVVPEPKRKSKKRSFFNWKVKLFVWFVLLCVVAAGVAQLFIWVGGWFDQNKIVPHQVIEVKVNPPFTIEPRVISPVASPSAEMETAEPVVTPEAMRVVQPVLAQEPPLIDQLVSYIHLAESTRGKAQVGLNATCKSKGMSNEFGYRAGEGFCFPNHDVAVETVKDWLYRSLQVRGVPETLCRYNIGTPVDNCEYANKFMSLLSEGKI